MKPISVSVIRRPVVLLARCACAVALNAAVFMPATALQTAESAIEPIQSVRSRAEEVVRAQLTGVNRTLYVRAADLDSRLRLNRCPEVPTGELAPGTQPSAHMSVRVSCRTPTVSWSLYVPVSVESDTTVLVLKEGAAAGSRLNPAQVVPQVRRVAGLAADYVSDVSGLQRHTLVRALPAGAALTPDVLLADYLVRQGQQVTIVAAGPGIEVRAPAKALEDGREGARVRVQNLASLKIVQGTVSADGLIRVTP